MKNVTYDYSSVHVDIPKEIADDIIKWGRKEISDREIFVMPRDPGLGREDEIHATVLYGLHTDKPDQVQKLVSGQEPPKVRLGKVEVFTNPDKYDVVVIHVISHDLRRLNKMLRDNVAYTNKYDSYRPHVTIAYVKKGKGWQYRGTDIWEGREFTCNHLVFSSTDGTKHKITFK